MTNVSQTPQKKLEDRDYSKQSGKPNPQNNQGNTQSGGQNRDQSKQDHSGRNDDQDANRSGGMKDEPTSGDTRREREEEDRPRADKKSY